MQVVHLPARVKGFSQLEKIVFLIVYQGHNTWAVSSIKGISFVAVQVRSSCSVSLFLAHKPEKQINF